VTAARRARRCGRQWRTLRRPTAPTARRRPPSSRRPRPPATGACQGARVQQLAADAIGLYVEGYFYGYDRDQARAAAVRECLEGEAARAEVPRPERHAAALAEPAPPDVAGFARLVERAERVRGGGER
jgi:hypothetical protein